MQIDQLNSLFVHDLVDIGRYYNDYVNLMDHWEQVTPGTILRVHYENVVNDFEGQVARILDFCGLAFEQACLDFYQTERAVRTASSEQVRQPIFDTGLEQWKHFQPYLQDHILHQDSSLLQCPLYLLRERFVITI